MMKINISRIFVILSEANSWRRLRVDKSSYNILILFTFLQFFGNFDNCIVCYPLANCVNSYYET